MDILSVQQLLLDTPTGATSLPLGLSSGGQGAGVQKPRPRLNVQKAVEYSVGGESHQLSRVFAALLRAKQVVRSCS